MAKQKQSVAELIDNLQEEISEHHQVEIPDIITFVESQEWLGLPFHPTNPINLFPMQKAMLKAFYRGSKGNEDLKLTDAEIQMIEEAGLNDNERGNVIDKYNNGELFRELVLVWGRRCLSEDMTIIDPKDGSINRIGDLWDKGVKNINSWTYDEEKNKMREIEDASIIYQGKRKCYELITNSGNRIECTENHPFLTPRGWIKLKDLDIEKDKIAIVEEIPFFGDQKR
jgi:hypothetical protein